MTIEAAMEALEQDSPVRRKKLVAVSGGRDSTVLLHALHAAGHRRLVVCHLNHRLRGRASAADAAFVRKLAKHFHFECEAGTEDVGREAAMKGVSVETAGREARHRFFADCARRHRCRTLLMAHHADDQAETVLFNLFRGSSGLRGMNERTDLRVPGRRPALHILRPFLKVTRAVIDAYAAEHGVTFREDASNAETGPVRNRMRRDLLPAICQAMGRDVRPALCRAAEVAADESEMLTGMAIPYAEAAEPDVRLLARLHRALQRRVIHLWLMRNGFTGIGFHEVEAVRSMLDPAGGPACVNLPGNRFVRRSKAKLRAMP
ncbi:MAG TPA: tRNA lysidine(34) synthetase TilS [Verrucomicrobiales bacterium]|nr:tRNA lysidine(34) synthetase TilS [Verrucomicrobiales bacterium]